jgi:hypothetical protein
MSRILTSRLIVNLMVILAAVGITTRSVAVVFPAIAMLAIGGLIAWHRSALGVVVSCWILILWAGRAHALPTMSAGDLSLVAVLGMTAVLGTIWAQRLAPPVPPATLPMPRTARAVEPPSFVLDRAG